MAFGGFSGDTGQGYVSAAGTRSNSFEVVLRSGVPSEVNDVVCLAPGLTVVGTDNEVVIAGLTDTADVALHPVGRPDKPVKALMQWRTINSAVPSVMIGGLFEGGVRHWDGQQVFDSGAPPLEPPCVYDLAPVDPWAQMTWDFYAVGCFTSAAGEAVNAVARYVWDLDGRNEPFWEPLGEGITGVDAEKGATAQVFAASTSDTLAFFGGDFQSAGSSVANNVAWWDRQTSEWGTLGQGVFGVVRALQAAPDGRGVYVGGKFCSRDRTDVCNLAWWDLAHGWVTFGGSVKGEVLSLMMAASHLWIGGRFVVPETHDQNLAVWTGHSWASNAAGIRQVDGKRDIIQAFASCPCREGEVYVAKFGMCAEAHDVPGAGHGHAGMLLLLCVVGVLAAGGMAAALVFVVKKRRQYGQRYQVLRQSGEAAKPAFTTYGMSQGVGGEGNFEDDGDYEDDL